MRPSCAISVRHLHIVHVMSSHKSSNALCAVIEHVACWCVLEQGLSSVCILKL